MQIGISCRGIVAKYGYEEAFKLVKESGFDAVDIGLGAYGNRENQQDIYLASEDRFQAYFENIKKLADRYELIISQTHGRCTTYTPDPEQQAYARWVSELDLKATSILGAPACVIHQVASGKWPDNYLDVEFMHRKNKEFFDFLIPVAEAYKTCFSLETFGRATVRGDKTVDLWADIALLKEQYDMLDTDYKTMCVDTGHTNEAIPFGRPTAGETIRMLGKAVTLLHLHDNNGTYDQHLIPLVGDPGAVDWPDVFDALDEIGYNGVYNFELNLSRFMYALPEAIRFLGKSLRCFAENRGRKL